VTIRVAIVDDEPLAVDRMRRLLAGEPDIQVVAECSNGAEAVAAIRSHAPDLVFLDVQMPGLDGFGVVEQVGPEAMPATIFATAFDEHALQAFDASALDYLLKPFDPDRFARALNRARRVLRLQDREEIEAKLTSMLRGLNRTRRYLDRFVVRYGRRILFVNAAEVDRIEADGNYAAIHMGKQVHLLREALARLEAQLDPAVFVRIHRSHIVAVDRVHQLESVFQGEYVVTLKDGTRITSSRTYRERLERAVGI
jgi:two-component system LytT family response regulator